MAMRPRRSVLYLPGDNERALEKARTLAADSIIIDLEDSVAPTNKEKARSQAIAAIREGGFGSREVILRVNPIETPWGMGDLHAAIAVAPDAILIPKVSQSGDITGIKKLHGAAKCDVFNSLMVRQIELIGERGPFNMPFQFGPARKSMFASDGELRVAEAERGVENFNVRGMDETRKKFPEALRGVLIASSMRLEQVFSLILEMTEVGIRWEAFYRHDELPFVSPRSAFTGRK